MKTVLSIFLCCVAACVTSCMHKQSNSHYCGIDEMFSDLDLGVKSTYVHIFLTKVFEEMDKRSSLNLEKVPRNGFNLFEGLRLGEYPIILTSTPKNIISESKYVFSEPLLKTGPVLVVKKKAKDRTLAQLNTNEANSIAVSEDPKYYQFMLNYPYVLISEYASIPSALDDVVSGKRQGALIPNLLALSYVKNLYGDTLEIVSTPLNDEGIRFVSLRGDNEEVLRDTNKALMKLMKSAQFSRLRKEWNL